MTTMRQLLDADPSSAFIADSAVDALLRSMQVASQDAIEPRRETGTVTMATTERLGSFSLDLCPLPGLQDPRPYLLTWRGDPGARVWLPPGRVPRRGTSPAALRPRADGPVQGTHPRCQHHHRRRRVPHPHGGIGGARRHRPLPRHRGHHLRRRAPEPVAQPGRHPTMSSTCPCQPADGAARPHGLRFRIHARHRARPCRPFRPGRWRGDRRQSRWPRRPTLRPGKALPSIARASSCPAALPRRPPGGRPGLQLGLPPTPGIDLIVHARCRPRATGRPSACASSAAIRPPRASRLRPRPSSKRLRSCRCTAATRTSARPADLCRRLAGAGAAALRAQAGWRRRGPPTSEMSLAAGEPGARRPRRRSTARPRPGLAQKSPSPRPPWLRR